MYVDKAPAKLKSFYYVYLVLLYLTRHINENTGVEIQFHLIYTAPVLSFQNFSPDLV